ADDAGLRRRVVRLAGVPVQADDAREVDDRPAAAAHHPAGGGTAGVEDAAQVRVDYGAPILVGHPGDQTVARQPGVVDEDVQLAGLLDEPRRVLRLRDVGL